MLFSAPTVSVPDAQAQGAARAGVLREAADGFRYVLRTGGLFFVVGTCTLVNIGVGPCQALRPLLVKEVFGGGALELSWITVAGGVGLAAGGAIMSAWGGFKRNLLASEILGQAVAINRMEGGTAKERAVTNIVLMGSGEPLDNYDNVLRFLSDATRKDGINFSERNISLSTSGLCDRIRDLADSGFKITLSISLHGADDSIRSSIMPVNRRYGVKEVIGAARYYFERTGRRVIFEYILIDGVNDSRADAVKLAALVKGFPAHINVIRYNEVDGKSMKSPSVRSTEDFVAGLNALGASATLRHSFGGNIEGACGQVKRRYTTEAGN